MLQAQIVAILSVSEHGIHCEEEGKQIERGSLLFTDSSELFLKFIPIHETRLEA